MQLFRIVPRAGEYECDALLRVAVLGCLFYVAQRTQPMAQILYAPAAPCAQAVAVPKLAFC